MKFEKIKIETIDDVEVGDVVFSWSKSKPFFVIRKGYTILHNHLYLKIINAEGEITKVYHEHFKIGEEILKFQKVSG